MRFIRRIALALIAAGILTHVGVAVFGAAPPFTVFDFGLFVWSSLPYVACSIVLLLWVLPTVAIGGALAALLVDALTIDTVFIHPRHSTAAVALLFIPLWNLILIMPIGMLCGYGVNRQRARGN